MKYIDADKLRKSIGNYVEGAHAALNPIDDDADYYKGKIDACKDIQELIISLQQEQPKQDAPPSLNKKEIICLKRTLDYLRKEHNCYGGEDFTNEIAVLEWLITHSTLSSDTHWKPSEKSQECNKERKSDLQQMDERIRKAIVKLVEWVKEQQIHTDHFNDDIKWDEMLAYLGRQKEQKPVILGPDETEFPYNHPANTLEGEIKNIWSKLSVENAFVASFEGFREVIFHFVNFVQKEQKAANATQTDANAEWSEKDERIMDNCIEYIKASCLDVNDLYECIDWLELLHKRFNQRPKQEWNEEDKRCFDEAIEALESLNFDGEASNLKSIRDCRKSLNTWKPSEEQVEALRIYLYHPQYINNLDDIKIKLVESLYNDLQKLL